MGSSLAGMAKQLVGMINVVLLAGGAVATILGLLLAVASSQVTTVIFPVIEIYVKFAGRVTDRSDDIPGTLQTAGYVLLGLGAPLFAAGLLGCCGICFNKKKWLYAYALVSAVLCLAILALFFVYLFKAVDEQVYDALLRDLQQNYAGFTSLNQQSLFINAIQSELHCCGVTSYTDYNATKWDKTYISSDGSKKSGAEVPESCCKLFNGTFPNGAIEDVDGCVTDSTSNSRWKTGCKEAITNALKSNEAIVIVVFITAALLEALAVFLSVYLISQIRKKEKQQTADQQQQQQQATEQQQTPEAAFAEQQVDPSQAAVPYNPNYNNPSQFGQYGQYGDPALVADPGQYGNLGLLSNPGLYTDPGLPADPGQYVDPYSPPPGDYYGMYGYGSSPYYDDMMGSYGYEGPTPMGMMKRQMRPVPRRPVIPQPIRRQPFRPRQGYRTPVQAFNRYRSPMSGARYMPYRGFM